MIDISEATCRGGGTCSIAVNADSGLDGVLKEF